jgi:hypothetical protein
VREDAAAAWSNAGVREPEPEPPAGKARTRAAAEAALAAAVDVAFEEVGRPARGVWRFAHLGFQEHLCSRALLGRLTESVDTARRATARDQLSEFLRGKLHDRWWREPLLLLAAAAEEPLLTAALDALLADDDYTGANGWLVLRLLEERPGFHAMHEFREASLAVRQRHIVAAMASIVSHPGRGFQAAAIAEMAGIGFRIDAVVTQLVLALRRTRTGSWIELTSLLRSLVALQTSSADARLSEAIVDDVLPHPDPRVAAAGVGALGALGASNSKIMGALIERLAAGPPAILDGVAQAASQLGLGWAEIARKLRQRLVDAHHDGARRTPREGIELHLGVIAALLGAGTGGGDVVAPTLELALQHPSPEVAAAAARALGELQREVRVTRWVMEKIVARHPLEERTAAITCLRALAQQQLDAAGGASAAVADAFVAVLRDRHVGVLQVSVTTRTTHHTSL